MRLFVFPFLVLSLGADVASAGGVFPGAEPDPVPVPLQDLGPDALPPSLDDLDTLLVDPKAGDPEQPLAEGEDRPSGLDLLFEDLAMAEGDMQAAKRARRIQVQWLKSGSDTVDLLMSRAGAALQQEDLTLALDLLDVVVTLAPNYAEGWNRRATVFYLQSDLPKSLADIERTLALEPRHWGALSGLGLIQRRLGQEERALATFRRALEIHPGLTNAREAVESLEKEAEGQPV